MLELGATNLQAKLGAFVASFGDNCWRTDAAAREVLRRSDGRQYHRESIGRARRAMKRRGWINSDRVMPQQTPAGARFRSANGTTNKSIVWKVLGVKSPLSKGEKRERRRVQNAADRLPAGPAPVYQPRGRTVIPPGVAALVAGIGSSSEPAASARERARAAAGVPARVVRAERERAELGDLEERRAQAKRDLAAWAREHDDDPPP